ncbi:TPA: tetratricopeptide repeat protein, partial [Bacillus paranthracis]|nr:tetratricopeptide repeat protein [Bacillus paranthracis]
PKLAEDEVQRLKEQSIKIDVINIKESMYYKQVVEKITNIDGALYMDINGYIHAIGVILDGYAEAGAGDSARGARYNSAIRYKNGKDINGKCVIIVISEDGMIDIIPDSEIEKQISKLVRQINDLNKNKNFQEALDLVNTLETLNPKRPETYYSKASILKRMRNRQEEALDAVTYAIQLKEDYQAAYNLRGLLYNKMKQPEKALNDFEKSLKLGPSYIAYLNLGNILGEFERFDEAIIPFSKAIEINSRIPTAYHGRMTAYVHIDEFEKALEDAKTLLKLKENDPFLLGVQGNLYRILEDNEKAIDSLKKSIYEYNKYLDGNNDMEVYKTLVGLCGDILECNISEEEKEEFQQLLKDYKEKLVELENKEN